MKTTSARLSPLAEQPDSLKLQLTMVLPRSGLDGATPEATAMSVQAYLGRGIPCAGGGAIFPEHVAVDHVVETSTPPPAEIAEGFRARWALVATVEFFALLTIVVIALSYVDFDAAFAMIEQSLELWPTPGKRPGHWH